MHALNTVVLEHTTRTGVHYDWLVEDPRLADPRAPKARLWTARVPRPPSQWCRSGCFTIEVLTPHRRTYLQYQGRVSNDRGRVRRIAEGVCVPSIWSDGRVVMTMGVDGECLAIDLRRLACERWRMVVDWLGDPGTDHGDGRRG